MRPQSLPRPGISPWPQDGQPWIQEPPGAFPVAGQPPAGPAVPQAAGGPLGDFQQSYAQVMVGAAPRGLRREPIAESWLKGAAIGFGSALVWRQMKRRRAAKGEYTSPGVRALALLLGFPAVGLVLSMLWVPESRYLVGWGCVLGAVSLIVYTIFRACGGGNYNSRRQGSPWREDHQP